MTILVADVDMAKAFYVGLGGRLDADFAFDNGFRVVQLTPPGSPCSLQFGDGGKYDENWPDWYAAYMVAEAAGTELPT